MKNKLSIALVLIYIFALLGCDFINDLFGINEEDEIIPGETILTIRNESFSDITEVIWQGVSFSNNIDNNLIKIGTKVTNTVEPGIGYIYFRRENSPLFARTSALVVVDKNKQVDFLFIDSTVIVEMVNMYNISNVNNNTGTLRSLQSIIVWWDDAEGEMKPYFEKREWVFLYDEELFNELLDYGDLIYPPKNGNYSIGIGEFHENVIPMLHLRVNLNRKAKISFWYSNYSLDDPLGAVFSINGEVNRRWTNDVDWSFHEVELEPGINNIIWEKFDSYDENDEYFWFQFLCLDDILIYYTE